MDWRCTRRGARSEYPARDGQHRLRRIPDGPGKRSLDEVRGASEAMRLKTRRVGETGDRLFIVESLKEQLRRGPGRPPLPAECRELALRLPRRTRGGAMSASGASCSSSAIESPRPASATCSAVTAPRPHRGEQDSPGVASSRLTAGQSWPVTTSRCCDAMSQLQLSELRSRVGGDQEDSTWGSAPRPY